MRNSIIVFILFFLICFGVHGSGTDTVLLNADEMTIETVLQKFPASFEAQLDETTQNIILADFKVLFAKTTFTSTSNPSGVGGMFKGRYVFYTKYVDYSSLTPRPKVWSILEASKESKNRLFGTVGLIDGNENLLITKMLSDEYLKAISYLKMHEQPITKLEGFLRDIKSENTRDGNIFYIGTKDKIPRSAESVLIKQYSHCDWQQPSILVLSDLADYSVKASVELAVRITGQCSDNNREGFVAIYAHGDWKILIASNE